MWDALFVMAGLVNAVVALYAMAYPTHCFPGAPLFIMVLPGMMWAHSTLMLALACGLVVGDDDANPTKINVSIVMLTYHVMLATTLLSRWCRRLSVPVLSKYTPTTNVVAASFVHLGLILGFASYLQAYGRGGTVLSWLLAGIVVAALLPLMLPMLDTPCPEASCLAWMTEPHSPTGVSSVSSSSFPATIVVQHADGHVSSSPVSSGVEEQASPAPASPLSSAPTSVSVSADSRYGARVTPLVG